MLFVRHQHLRARITIAAPFMASDLLAANGLMSYERGPWPGSARIDQGTALNRA